MNNATMLRLTVPLTLLTAALPRLLDPDMWWHLATGQYILTNGIPSHDVFSLTARDHRWITHEWLTEVIMASAYNGAGFLGVMVLFGVIIAVGWYAVYRTAARTNAYSAALMTAWGIWVAMPTLDARPQMVTLLMTALYAAIIEYHRSLPPERRSAKLLLLLPPLMVVWVNAHSGYLMGVAVLGAYIVGDGLHRLLVKTGDGIWTWHDLKVAAGIAVMCGLSAILNPNGIALWLYPFETLGSPVMQQYIAEWQSPNFHSSLYFPFATMILAGVALHTQSRKSTVTDLLLFCAGVTAGLLAARHITLFAVLAVPILTRRLQEWYDRFQHPETVIPPSPTRFTRWANIVLVIGCFCAPLAIGYVNLQERPTRIAQLYPVNAVKYIYSNDLATARGFNEYGWGGYLIWQGITPFVDGRADVYGEDHTRTAFRTILGSDEWRDTFEQHALTYALIPVTSPLATVLYASPDWEEVYRDEIAIVFTQVTEVSAGK